MGKAGRSGGSSAADVADHRAKATVAQALLHQTGDVGIVGRRDADQPGGRQADGGKVGREQVLTAGDPQDRAPAARGEAGEEQSGRDLVIERRRRGGDVVQRIQPQPAIGQQQVDTLDPERHFRAAVVTVALQAAEQGLERHKGATRRGHGITDYRSWSVLFARRVSLLQTSSSGTAES